MLIVSKFHDYYDVVKTFGIDKSVVYKRKVEDIRGEVFEKDEVDYSFRFDRNLVLKFKISVCGMVYRGLSFDNRYYYRVEGFLQELGNRDKDELGEFLKQNKRVVSYFGVGYSERVFKKHIEYRTPIITQREKYSREFVVEKDSCLREFNFERVVDPYSMFQRIQQFVSGVLTNVEKEPWPIGDKLKAQSHGYDEFSFRRMEHQRKSRR